MDKTIIKFDNKGRATLPNWVCKSLLKTSGVRSKRFRQQKKTIKKEFIKLMKETHERG